MLFSTYKVVLELLNKEFYKRKQNEILHALIRFIIHEKRN